MQEQETWDDLPDPWADDCALPAYLRAYNVRETAKMRRWQRNKLYAPLMGCPPLLIPWLLAKHTQRGAADKEGAHAKRTVTR
jgi:hypothetical protein